MPLEALAAVESHPARRRPGLESPRPRIADVAVLHGERSGGVRTYLEAKAAYAASTGAFEHHLIVPGRRERHDGGRHELRAVRLAASNGYRLPIGARSLAKTLRELEPDLVVLHDPYWRPLATSRVAQAGGAVVVHHCSTGHAAASIPGPYRAYHPFLRGWFRHAYRGVDAVMSAADAAWDVARQADLPLRLGLDPAFRPRPDIERGDHVLYVGRLGREKGVFELLEAAAAAPEPWPLRIGTGPRGDALRARAQRLGIGRRVSFEPYVPGCEALARIYAAARCVVMPGRWETFGLVALEAAASGATVVACSNAPSAASIGPLAHTFAPGDVQGLAQAIERARAADRDLVASAELAESFGWEGAIAAELADLQRLLTRPA